MPTTTSVSVWSASPRTNSLPFSTLDQIQITYQPKTMATPAALTSDDMPPGPLTEEDIRRGWNQQADEHNQWESLDSEEQLAWAQALAIKAHRPVAALKAELEGEGPTDEDLYSLAEQFHGDPVPAMRRALEPVAELDDQRREAVHQAVAEALGSGAYDCTRVWSAWQVGTMGEDDFVPVAEDPDRVAEIADAAIEAIRAIPLPAPQAGEVALAGDRRLAESLQLAHASCRLFGTNNGDCPDSEICWLDSLPCSHYENCDTIPAPQDGEVE